MSLPTKYTGLILASGELVKDPTFKILETLAPFKVSILESQLLTVRERFVLSLVIELNPDHREAIATDLELLTESGQVDVAYDFKSRPLITPIEKLLEVRVVSKQFSAESLFQVEQALQLSGPICDFSIVNLGELTLLKVAISAQEGDSEEISRALSLIADHFSLSFTLYDPATQVIGRDSLILDMDSTFINEEVIDIIADIAGVGAEVAQITERAMRGELDFAQALQERVALLEGKPSSILDEAKSRISLTTGAEDLVQAVKRRGGVVGVVSGGFHDVIDSILEPLGLDLIRANRFEVVDGRLTGRLLGGIVDREVKEATRRDFAKGYSRSIAIGDGANDIAMIEGADIGIAFVAKEILREAADLIIRTRDLRAVLPLIGY